MSLTIAPKQPSEAAAELTLANPKDISRTLEGIKKAVKKRDMGAMILSWQRHDKTLWAGSPELYSELGGSFLKMSEPIMAYDVLKEGMKFFPESLRMHQLMALALARSGVPEGANQILTRLREKGHNDQETMGLLARTHKDLAMNERSFRERQEHLKMAYLLYDEAYKKDGGYWTGINAATVSLLMGLKRISRELAADIYKKCEADAEKHRAARVDGTYDESAYWLLATLGEASLISEDYEKAREWYARAGECGAGHYGDLNSTRRNAALIMDSLKTPPATRQEIDACFKIPAVAVFSGHMIDRPGRPVPRFPAYLEAAVSAEIEKRIAGANVGFGFASGACGSDIIFLETVLRHGGEAHLILPYDRLQFVKNSVDVIEGASWAYRFNEIVRKATHVTTASENMFEEDSISYEYANLLLTGMARMKASQIGTKILPLTVWDKMAGDGPGGTACAVNKFEKLGVDIEIIDLREIMRSTAPEVYDASAAREQRPAGARTANRFETKIMSLLFADLYHFRQLTEQQIPYYIEEFLGAVGKLTSSSKNAPTLKKTWGDGLYFVFDSVRAAGLFALELRDMVNSTAWTQKNLPENINFRMALHAGPVYSYIDPVTEHLNYIGTHVVYAARIEPITPVGQVYSSQAFAAIASAEMIKDFRCEYVGQIPLAKGHGTYPIYHVKNS